MAAFVPLLNACGARSASRTRARSRTGSAVVVVRNSLHDDDRASSPPPASAPTTTTTTSSSVDHDWFPGCARPSLEEIQSSLVYEAAGLPDDPDAQVWEEWWRYADTFVQELRHLQNEATTEKIYFYYLPMFMWMRSKVRRKIAEAKRAGRDPRAVVFGFSAPQGGMKTVVSAILVKVFAAEGLNCVTVATDDFYLTRAEQVRLAEANRANPLLEFRGNPGTMDVELMIRTLEELTVAREGDVVRVPRYDKSAHGGRGDRCPEDAWEVVEGPVDVVIFEGWCLGFRPMAAESLELEEMEQINEFLADFSRVYESLDDLIVVQIPELSWVYHWRKEAEDRMKRRGKPGMNDAQIRAFVDRFIPTYRQYLASFYAEELFPGGAQLNIEVDFQRAPVKRGQKRVPPPTTTTTRAASPSLTPMTSSTPPPPSTTTSSATRDTTRSVASSSAPPPPRRTCEGV